MYYLAELFKFICIYSQTFIDHNRVIPKQRLWRIHSPGNQETVITYSTSIIRCIRALRFGHLKRGFRRFFSFSAQKCARKVRLYKSCTSAASESEFNHANRILSLKVGVLIYTVHGHQNVKANYRSLSYSMVALQVASLLRNRPWHRLHTFFVLRHARRWERTTPMYLKLHQKPLHLLTVPIRSRARVWNLFVCVWPKARE